MIDILREHGDYFVHSDTNAGVRKSDSKTTHLIY